MTTQEETIIKEFYAEAKREYDAALASYQKNPDSKHAREQHQDAYTKHKAVFDLCCLLNITVWTDNEK